MLAELTAAYAAAKNIKEMHDTIVDIETDSRVKEVLVKLNGTIQTLHESIFEMQSRHAAMLQTESDLKEQVAKLEDWKTKSSNYQLNELASGVFVYTLKSDVDSTEPTHHVCTNCYQDGRALILIGQEPNSDGSQEHVCPSCQTVYNDYSGKEPEEPYRHEKRPPLSRR